MFFIKYLLFNNRVFFLFFFKKSALSSFLILRCMFLKYSFNWISCSFFFKEFFYDNGFLKWKKK